MGPTDRTSALDQRTRLKMLVRVASDERQDVQLHTRRRAFGTSSRTEVVEHPRRYAGRDGFGRGGSVEDLLGLGEDRWWERLLDRWAHLPDRLRSSIERGLIGALVVGVFLLLNLLMGMPLG